MESHGRQEHILRLPARQTQAKRTQIMTEEHLLSTQNIKNAFVQGRLWLYTEIPAEAISRNEENFDAWLAAHDADVLQRAMAVIAKDTVRKGVFES
jgi:hypothetical protein